MRTIIIVTALGVLVGGCGDGSGPGPAPRPFLMGFSAIPPRLDSTVNVILAIDNWAPHADAAIMHVSSSTSVSNAGSPCFTNSSPRTAMRNRPGRGCVFTMDLGKHAS